MDKDTLTLALEGHVGLDDFNKAIGHFSRLIHKLSAELSGGADIEWWISDLSSDSAVATIQGVSMTAGVVPLVVDGYVQIGEALSKGEDVPFSLGVQDEAYALAQLVNGHITQVRFQTPEVAWAVMGGGPSAGHPIKYTYGSVVGRVQTLSMRKGLKFTLYDAIFDRAVSCYLRADQEEIMRNAWGRRTVVSGSIGREPDHGYAVVVHDVTSIQVVEPVEPGSYKQARGAIPWHEGDEPGATIIRRMRDAE
jgi:hypothetical protein